MSEIASAGRQAAQPTYRDRKRNTATRPDEIPQGERERERERGVRSVHLDNMHRDNYNMSIVGAQWDMVG